METQTWYSNHIQSDLPTGQQRQRPAIHYLGDNISESCLSDIYDALPWQLLLFWIPFRKIYQTAVVEFWFKPHLLTASPNLLVSCLVEMKKLRTERILDTGPWGKWAPCLSEDRERVSCVCRKLSRAQGLSAHLLCSSSGGQKFNIGKSHDRACGLQGEPTSSPSHWRSI